ncbi:MAG TPA: bifunctional DNA-formamidopyrimidine glycosylase/DNA-(apurinic or apyrimidinic site) lyase, partial [Candidatus Acetothermia bacterium]|nr:bifunctional DNA-formamidopyrimidine glycosylase/DNA-(apurinic or apyrimidinic site) lyase [Candidatus Acetothermia bacterium]
MWTFRARCRRETSSMVIKWSRCRHTYTVSAPIAWKSRMQRGGRMPELPEVETIVRGLNSVTGARIERVDVFDQRLNPPKSKISGRTIERVERRGKYIVINLAEGGSLIVHLRMSGRLALKRPTAEEKHTRFILHLDDGRKIYFINPRRLGTVEYTVDGFPYELGIEPLSREFTAERLRDLVAGSRAPIKPLLMDQKKIAGLGNIYSSEALWRVKIDPRRIAKTISDDEARKLHRAIQSILRQAIESAGTTFGYTVSDYRDAYGDYGKFQEMLAVYGRAGEECPRCGEGIMRIKQAGRSTYF